MLLLVGIPASFCRCQIVVIFIDKTAADVTGAGVARAAMDLPLSSCTTFCSNLLYFWILWKVHHLSWFDFLEKHLVERVVMVFLPIAFVGANVEELLLTMFLVLLRVWELPSHCWVHLCEVLRTLNLFDFPLLSCSRPKLFNVYQRKLLVSCLGVVGYFGKLLLQRVCPLLVLVSNSRIHCCHFEVRLVLCRWCF